MDRYLLRELLVPLAYCLGGFLIFYIAFDLVFHTNQFQEKHLLFSDVVEYYVVILPEILANQVIPVSLLLAALYALTNHNRYNELTAFRAAGVSLWRLSLPYLLVGAACGATIFVLNEFWVPKVAETSKYILDRRIDANATEEWTPRLEFHNDADERYWNIGRFNKLTAEMISPYIRWQTPDGAIHWVSAKSAVRTNGAWRFLLVDRWDQALTELAATESTNASVDIPFSETPDSIRTEIKVSTLNPVDAAKDPQLSIRELVTYLHWHKHLDKQKKAAVLTQLQNRLAAPFTCLAVVLIALPFGARSGRHNVFVGVAGSIFICFAYFILERISVSLGVGAYLPPMVAAWSPNVLFGGIGLFLMSRLR